MSFWDLENLKSVMGASWLVRPDARHALGEALGASIDTRTLKRGNVFFALKGEHADGHRFLGAAAKAGASVAVVEDVDACDSLPDGLPVLRVESVGAALLRAAGEYRKTLEGTRVISVGGSNGKTTTTRLIESVLASRMRGVASQKSFNNSIGVPLTIFSAKKGDQFLICEVGTNAPGEIAELARIVAPDIAVITSIGREHLEGLSSLHGVITEEASIAAAIQPGGAALIAGEPKELLDTVRGLASAGRHAVNIVRFGLGDDAELRIGGVSADELGTSFTINKRGKFRVPLLGAHNAINGAAAVAVARRFGMDDDAIRQGLSGAHGPEMRMRLEIKGQTAVLNDAYNANPDSMLAAIRAFAELSKQRNPARRVVVLGDMLEMGEAGPDAHREIGDVLAADTGIDMAVLVGPLMMFAAERLRKKWTGERVVNLPGLEGDGAARVAGMLRAGDFVLLKGSRGMGLERVTKAMDSGGVAARPRQEQEA